MNRDLWEECGHNPVLMLGLLDQKKVNELVKDEGFLDQLERVNRAFERYMSQMTPYSFQLEKPADYKIAYLSAEYGLTECLPLYSGGLGILSGDHLKSASDLNIPLVAVGLLYKEGYFHQVLNIDGWQVERYPDNNFYSMPIERIQNEKGSPLEVSIPMGNRKIIAHIWKIQVGRVSLYLLDTNNRANSQSDREITGKLYGGDREMRLQQEIVLGIGGVRALGALGIKPIVFHMNEGHSAFASLERIRFLKTNQGMNFNEAMEFVIASSVFTTHTPVPAGNDVFDQELMTKYFASYSESIGIPFNQLLELGKINVQDKNEPFCMTVFAMKSAAWCNGVSKIHSRVSKSMWKELWPNLTLKDIPIHPLTNGVHIPSWISLEMEQLYDRYLGPRWSEDPDNEKVWEQAMKIPDTELWRTKERRRERLIAFSRRRLANQLTRNGASRSELESAWNVLNPKALTIGFARRFATYKRGNLLFTDLDRLDKILNNRERPVQIIFAGKAHPADNNGKEFIKRIIQVSNDPRFRNRIVFIEDYNIHIARYLVQGCDVWLNNPRRPLEACGTSGMKAAANGILNMSVLDGWWDEAYKPELGWAIGNGEEHTEDAYADLMESRHIYDLLEKEIVPIFYKRGTDDLPHEWIQMMKSGLKHICPVFNSHRMVEDYMTQFYHPAASIALKLKEKNYAGAKALAEWKNRLNQAWSNVQILDVETSAERENKVNSELNVKVKVRVGELAPEDLSVEAYYGRLNLDNEITDSITVELFPTDKSDEATIYSGKLKLFQVGRFGMTIRVMPKHELNVNPLHSGIVKWG